MLKRFLIASVLTTFLQVTVYVLLLQTGIFVSGYFNHLHNSVSFGISVSVSIVLFSIVIFFCNSITTLFAGRVVYFSVLVLAALMMVFYHLDHIYFRPYRTLFIMVSSLLAVFSKLPIDRMLTRFMTNYRG